MNSEQAFFARVVDTFNRWRGGTPLKDALYPFPRKDLPRVAMLLLAMAQDAGTETEERLIVDIVRMSEDSH